jgi:hypothetical protein
VDEHLALAHDRIVDEQLDLCVAGHAQHGLGVRLGDPHPLLAQRGQLRPVVIGVRLAQAI